MDETIMTNVSLRAIVRVVSIVVFGGFAWMAGVSYDQEAARPSSKMVDYLAAAGVRDAIVGQRKAVEASTREQLRQMLVQVGNETNTPRRAACRDVSRRGGDGAGGGEFVHSG